MGTTEVVEVKIRGEFASNMLQSFDKQMAAMINPCICVLNIESHGGYVHILEAMANTITEKKAQGFVFVTNVDKYAYSCGFMLFLMGDIKIASDSAELMYHAAGVEVWDRLTSIDAKQIYDELIACDLITDKIMIENTNIKPEMFAILKKNTNFFNRADMIHLGIMENEYTF